MFVGIEGFLKHSKYAIIPPCMHDVSLSMGSIVLAAAGMCILVSLLFLVDGGTGMWNFARALYSFGVVLLLIDR